MQPGIEGLIIQIVGGGYNTYSIDIWHTQYFSPGINWAETNIGQLAWTTELWFFYYQLMNIS